MTRLLVLSALLLLYGCGKGDAPVSSDVKAAPLLKQLRIAVAAPATGPCTAQSPAFDVSQTAYIAHVSKRMGIPVTLCPVATRNEAAMALTEGKIDLALLDLPSITPVKQAVRPIMTQRIPADMGRMEVVLAVPQASPIRSAADAKGRRMVLPADNSSVLAGIQGALNAFGFNRSAEVIEPTKASALAALKAGKADVLAMQSAQWVRLCRGEAKGETPCVGYRQIWRGREPALEAWSARRDLPLESWARLLGIHIALIQENPLAARWFAPQMTEIEPIEATGLEKPI
jgi:ABC-type phosphate/phosphonate transport system substrate-binding protein